MRNKLLNFFTEIISKLFQNNFIWRVTTVNSNVFTALECTDKSHRFDSGESNTVVRKSAWSAVVKQAAKRTRSFSRHYRQCACNTLTQPALGNGERGPCSLRFRATVWHDGFCHLEPASSWSPVATDWPVHCYRANKLTNMLFTVRLHVMQRTVLLSQFCPSVCLSVRQMRVLWEN